MKDFDEHQDDPAIIPVSDVDEPVKQPLITPHQIKTTPPIVPNTAEVLKNLKSLEDLPGYDTLPIDPRPTSSSRCLNFDFKFTHQNEKKSDEGTSQKRECTII